MFCRVVEGRVHEAPDRFRCFAEGTGLSLDFGMGIDTSCYPGWKGVNPTVEIVNVDFLDRDMSGEQATLF